MQQRKKIVKYRLSLYKIPAKTLAFYCCFGVLMVFAAGCALKVNTAYDASAPFETYERFCWFDNCLFTIDAPEYIKTDSATVEIYKDAIVQELEAKGYTYDANNPDFLLYMHIVMEEKQTLLVSPYTQGDTEDWQGAFPIGDSPSRTYTYLKGSLVIDIADANESRMVWRSDVVEYLDLVTDVTESRLRKGVRKALKEFPPETTTSVQN